MQNCPKFFAPPMLKNGCNSSQSILPPFQHPHTHEGWGEGNTSAPVLSISWIKPSEVVVMPNAVKCLKYNRVGQIVLPIKDKRIKYLQNMSKQIPGLTWSIVPLLEEVERPGTNIHISMKDRSLGNRRFSLIRKDESASSIAIHTHDIYILLTN